MAHRLGLPPLKTSDIAMGQDEPEILDMFAQVARMKPHDPDRYLSSSQSVLSLSLSSPAD